MEYAGLIDRILEAERNAREITREAYEKQACMAADLEKEAAGIRTEYFARADRRLERLKRETEEAKTKTIAAQTARFTEARAKMERAYSRYGDNWVDTLFRQTVGQKP